MWRYSEIRVLFLLVSNAFLYLVTTETSECVHDGVCAGYRPKLQDGCCPVPAGGGCREGPNGGCDLELDFRCRDGRCRGTFNVTATEVKDTSVTITWSPFLVPGSMYEYSVLYTTSLTEPLDKWNTHGVGDRTNVTLQELVPSTWYFSRLGIWVSGDYTNLTEIIVFQTHAKDHCQYNGKLISVKERILVDCSESCVCMPTGSFDCVPVCPRDNTETPVCSEAKEGTKCCDRMKHCEYNNCTYEGEEFSHEQNWNIRCEENCTCFNGEVRCTSLCETPVLPDNCTSPSPGKTEDGCCDTWECNDIDVCDFKNTSHNVGTWFSHANCDICTCSIDQQDIRCLNLDQCGYVQVPPHSTVCPEPLLIKNLCCDQIVCQRESDMKEFIEYFTVAKYSKSALIGRFRIIPSVNESDIRLIVFYFTNTSKESDYRKWRNVTFSLQNSIDFNNQSVRFAEFGQAEHLYRLDYEYFFVVPALRKDTIYYSKIGFFVGHESDPEHVRNNSSTEFASNTVVTNLQDLGNHYNGDHDVIVFVTTNVSSTTALLTWSVPVYRQMNITSYELKFKTFADQDWHFTERLIFSDTSYILSCLFHSRWYEVQLLAHPGGTTLATTFFNTTSIIESLDDRFATEIKDVRIGTTSVILQWSGVRRSIISEVLNFEVVWSVGNTDEKTWKFCVSAGSNSYRIENLVPGKQYIAWVGTILRSRKTIFSNRIHFVTTHKLSSKHSTPSHSIIVAVVISCISVIAMVLAILTVMYVTRCRRRSAYETSTSFENRIFQIYNQKDEGEI